MTDVRLARREAAARWFVLLGGMTAFALHLLTGFYLVPFTCLHGNRWPVYGATVLFGGVAAAATAMGWRRRDATGGVERPEWGPGRGSRTHRARFMVSAGIVLNILGLLIILYAGATTLAFDPCQNWWI